MLGKKLLKDRFLIKEIWFKHYWAITDSIESISYLLGLPNNYRMRYTWLRVEFPGKMALPKYISPKIHPTDHISTAFVYLEEPKSISGALYQRVATYSVIIGSVTDWLTLAMDRANPKSASLARQSESNRMFEGLRSRWISSPECIYLIPLRTLCRHIFTDRVHTSYVHAP
jgi:hypothetical protein